MEIKNLDPVAYDWNDLIIFNQTFDIYNNQLRIDGVFGFSLIIVFKIDSQDLLPKLHMLPNDDEKKVELTLTNFQNPLWTSTVRPLSILMLDENEAIGNNKNLREIFISLASRWIGEETSLYQVNVTLYAR